MHDFSKVIFFCFILLFSFSALCLDTKTKNIHYFFLGNDFSQDEVIPLPPVSGCHLTASDCTGSTPFFDAENCTCYCDKTSSDCLEDEIFNENYCRCEQCPEKMIPQNGHCICENEYLVDKGDGSGCYCPYEGQPCGMGTVIAANCLDCVCAVSPEICAERNGYFMDFGNDCACYICEGGKIVNEAGNDCVCPNGEKENELGNCCSSDPDEGLVCPVLNGIDDRGCFVYREKTDDDCAVGEVLSGCECVLQTVCKKDGAECFSHSECCGRICRESDGVCISEAWATAAGSNCPSGLSAYCSGINAAAGYNVGTNGCSVWARSDDGCYDSSFGCFPENECGGNCCSSGEVCCGGVCCPTGNCLW